MSAFDSTISVPSISTGTSLMVGSKQLAENTTTRMSPMDSLRAVFDDMRDTLEKIAFNTDQTAENIKTLVIGNLGKERDKGIREGETDVPPPAKEKGPGIFASLGNTLSNLNPFKDGMSPIMKFLLAGAALIGLRVFGEKLNEPLANLVKMFKEGTIVDNIKKTVEDIKERLEPIILDIKEGIGKFIDGVSTVFGLVMKAYEAVEGYIMSFDKNEDGTLDEAEKLALKEDLKQRATDAISGFFTDVLKSLAGLLLGATLINLTAKAAYARILPIFASTSTTAATAATGAAGARAAGVLPIAGLLLYGVTQTWGNISNSMKDTIEEQGKFTFSGFFSKFFGGDNEGGIMNALRKGFEVGGTFALAGMALGALLGSPFGGVGAVPGAIAGGLIGTGIGFLVGAFTGWLGSDKLKAFADGFTQMIDDAVASIKQFFTDIVDSVKSFFTGSPKKKAADGVRLTEEKNELVDEYNETYGKLQEQLQRQKAGKATVGLAFLQNKVKKLEAEIKEKEGEIANVPLAKAELAAGVTLERVEKNIGDKEFEIQVQQDLLNKAKTGQGVFMSKQDQDQLENVVIPKLENELIELEKTKNKLKEVSTGDVVLKTDVVPNKFDTVDASDRTGKSFNFTPINNNSNNTSVNKQETNAYTGGLTTDNTHFTALMMAHKKAKYG